MEFRRVTLQDCDRAAGAVVAIDVIRAFTTAAVALAAGAREIHLVDTVEEAVALRERLPGSRVMGEVGGIRHPAFDLGNSPSALAGMDLSGTPLIQRTSAGTQGVVRARPYAETLWAASLVTASATARAIRRLAPSVVTFVITGVHADDAENDGDEDAACADLLESLLRGEPPDREAIVRRVLGSHAAAKFKDPARPEFPAEDLPCCVEVDRYDLAMRVYRQRDMLLLRPER